VLGRCLLDVSDTWISSLWSCGRILVIMWLTKSGLDRSTVRSSNVIVGLGARRSATARSAKRPIWYEQIPLAFVKHATEFTQYTCTPYSVLPAGSTTGKNIQSSFVAICQGWTKCPREHCGIDSTVYRTVSLVLSHSMYVYGVFILLTIKSKVKEMARTNYLIRATPYLIATGRICTD
jgi:hypothetical protein